MPKSAEQLAKLHTISQLNTMANDVEGHLQTRARRIEAETRAYSEREVELNNSNAEELDAINRAIVLRETADGEAQDARQDREDARREYLQPLERAIEHNIRAAQFNRENPDGWPSEQWQLPGGFTDADQAEVRAKVERSLESEDRTNKMFGRGRHAAPTHLRAAESADKEFAELIRSLQPGRVELRAATLANSGASTSVFGNGAMNSLYLHDRLGISVQEATSNAVQSPYFAVPVAVAGTAEAGTKPTMSDPTLKTTAVAAYAKTITVSDQVARFGVGLNIFGQRLATEVAFSINKAFVDAAVTEGGTALTYSTSLAYMLDKAIATSAAKTGNLPSGIIINSADYPLLSTKTGADSADDIASQVVRWNGVNVYVNDAVTAGFAVVVDGMAWSVFQSKLIAASQPILTSNQVVLLGERYWCAIPSYAGAAVYVDIAA